MKIDSDFAIFAIAMILSIIGLALLFLLGTLSYISIEDCHQQECPTGMKPTVIQESCYCMIKSQ